ncbi:hypothetical protein Ddc_12264 [Ditylenchus destructor]|nr:hypothetical protein Ddc_12264 [Ditylenchus destructor]
MFWPLCAVEECPNLRKADKPGLSGAQTPAVQIDIDPEYWASCWDYDSNNENAWAEVGDTNYRPFANTEEDWAGDMNHLKRHKKKSKRKVQRDPVYPTWIGMDPHQWASLWHTVDDSDNEQAEDEAGATNDRSFAANEENCTSNKYNIESDDCLPTFSACMSRRQERSSCSRGSINNNENETESTISAPTTSVTTEHSVKSRDDSYSDYPKVTKKKSKRKVYRAPVYPTWIGMDPDEWKSCW